MVDKEEARRKLASAHYTFEPGITQIFTICAEPEYEARRGEPIKLLEVNQYTVPSGIMPLGFDPAPASGVPFPSVIVEVTPEEMGKIQRQELSLPNGWTLGPLLPRPDAAEAAGE
ncbi:MAG: hypothetical protein JWO38_5177 [Gemmataceae bacterium]|nr:hypothetical protein [Gemmataceae bacterium]